MHREGCAVSSDCRRDAPCLHMLEGLDLAQSRSKPNVRSRREHQTFQWGRGISEPDPELTLDVLYHPRDIGETSITYYFSSTE
jgi:hypothetical protein